MISETQMAYGSRVRRQGRGRAFRANHASSLCTMSLFLIRALGG
jgi:hypothetical protein